MIRVLIDVIFFKIWSVNEDITQFMYTVNNSQW